MSPIGQVTLVVAGFGFILFIVGAAFAIWDRKQRRGNQEE
jgi:hypothetical protein